MITDTELLRSRWFAGVAGLPCAMSFPVLLFFCGVAAKYLGTALHYHVGGKPMPALTEWVLDFADHLPGSLSAWLAIYFGIFLVAYAALLIPVLRSRSVAAVALSFALWIGVLLTGEVLIFAFVAFTLILPFAPSTGKLQPSAFAHPSVHPSGVVSSAAL